MTDQIAVLVLENAYFYYGENSFTGALSCSAANSQGRMAPFWQ